MSVKGTAVGKWRLAGRSYHGSEIVFIAQPGGGDYYTIETPYRPAEYILAETLKHLMYGATQESD
jgi:hypothetical protein